MNDPDNSNMDGFAVDLDDLLDEFEQNEGKSYRTSQNSNIHLLSSQYLVLVVV